MTSNSEFNQMLNKTAEVVRRAELARLYKYMLKLEGKVVEIKEVRENEYEVTVTYKRMGEANGLTVGWHNTQTVMLVPVQWRPDVVG